MTEPKYQFDVFFTKDISTNYHKATIKKNVFPTILNTGFFQFDENKYQKYFQVFRELKYLYQQNYLNILLK